MQERLNPLQAGHEAFSGTGASLDSARYCQARCAPEGSNLHYALLFETKQHRRLLCALHTYALEVGEIPRRQKDPGVTRIKLQWWQMELTRAREGKAAHPVTRELQSLLAPGATTWEKLLRFADACEAELAPQGAVQPSRARCFHWLGGPTAGSSGGDVALPELEELARLLTTYEILLVLPHPGTGPERGVLQTLAHHLRERRLQVPAVLRREHLPCLIMARLVEATCTKRVDRPPGRTPRHSVPGPLYKLWLAWRIYRWSHR